MSTNLGEVAAVKHRYAAASDPIADDDSFKLHVPTDAVRSGSLVATVARPGVARDALLTVADVLASDLRFKARDRADYLAYLIAQGKRVSNEVWEAQKAYLDEKYGGQDGAEAIPEGPLDPIVSVDEQGLAIEVFSADESAYARLLFKSGQAYEAQARTDGTTHLSIDEALLRGVGRMRSYRATTLEFSPGAAGGGTGEGIRERDVQVPLRWIRAFGQVQAASTLPAREFELAPIDLYNVLLTLRMRKAKTSPRALRYELVPGEAPRLVLEPWDLVIEGTGPVYPGASPVVVRTWGRNRLTTLARLLPHTKSVKVRLVGAGLPAFYVLDLGDCELTLALSGWTDSGWAGIATFDLLVAGEVDELLARKLLDALAVPGGRTLDELAEALGRPRNEVRQAILHHMQRGTVVHDLGSDRYLARSLLAEPPAAEVLRFRDEREQQAHRLLELPDAVRLTKVHDLAGEGTRIEGEVEDPQAHRTYRTSFTIDREGRTVDATCTSPQFRRSGLREGPTVPMIALRLLFARRQAELERARETEEGRKLIRAETRVLVRRQAPRRQVSGDSAATGSITYRLSLDDREVVVRWGSHPERMRMHRLRFASPDDARDEYFGRLEALGQKGFIDASAAEMA
ncbi:MAG: SWIM zinc finger family protein [Enhygromyxa sp.]